MDSKTDLKDFFSISAKFMFAVYDLIHHTRRVVEDDEKLDQTHFYAVQNYHRKLKQKIDDCVQAEDPEAINRLDGRFSKLSSDLSDYQSNKVHKFAEDLQQINHPHAELVHKVGDAVTLGITTFYSAGFYIETPRVGTNDKHATYARFEATIREMGKALLMIRLHHQDNDFGSPPSSPPFH
jgi:hypothetical protein